MTTSTPELEVPYSALITRGLVVLNICALWLMFFYPYITYTPGDEGPGPGFHAELSFLGAIIGAVLLNSFATALSAVVRVFASGTAVRAYAHVVYRACIFSMVWILLVGIPTCVVGKDIGSALVREAPNRE